MAAHREIVVRHVAKALAEAESESIPVDVVARTLLQEAVRLFRSERSVEDVAAELEFVIETLADDTDFPFSRPSG